MPNNLGRDNILSTELWGEIDTAVTWEAGRIRVTQKVFPGFPQTDRQYVSSDLFDLKTMEITEVRATPFVEISVEFRLPLEVVDSEATKGDVRIFARQAAKSLAVAEDKLFFQGAEVDLEPKVKVVNRDSVGDGLLHLEGSKTVQVPLLDDGDGSLYGANTFKAVAEGLALLNHDAQPGPYALILESSIYADTYAPLNSDALTTADRLIPLVPGGFYATGAVPASTGLLASVGGEPTSLYIDQDAITAHTVDDAARNAHFSVFERVQLIARDPESFVRLQFQKPAGSTRRVRAKVP